MAESDVVIIGGGHNGLAAAAYLARAGLSVTVLEGRKMVGGGAVTEELTLPGFKHDTFSSGHPWLLANPMIARDELGLHGEGLRYVGHDPLLAIPFEDGESIVIWRDVERSAAEFSRFSERDARSWRELHAVWKRVASENLRRISYAPGEAPDPDPACLSEFAHYASRSAVDVVNDLFESDHARALSIWLAAISVQPIWQPGTGILPVSIPAGLSEFGWINAVGGASALPEALARATTRQGGTIETQAVARHIRVESGRATAVETEDGRLFRARIAVLSAGHFTDLAGLIGQDKLPEEFLEGAQAWRGGSSLFVVQMALPFNQKVRTRHGSMPAVLTGRATFDGTLNHLVDSFEGRLTTKDMYVLAACSTLMDPSRAPDGRGTLKLIAAAPYALDGDPNNWTDDVKQSYARLLIEAYAGLVESFEPGDELGACVMAPPDLERINPGFRKGSPQGGEMVPDQMGLNRPLPGWARYRMPVQGLYQTGFTTHPGGPVTGWPGRHAAAAILRDLGRDIGDDANGTADFQWSCPVIDTSVT